MISKNTDKKSDLKVIGKNKVILTFISNKSLNGSGFKAEAKLSTYTIFMLYYYYNYIQ